jgi:hypothetical protein
MIMWDDDKAWFAPKRYGYGSGLPIAWQGWAALFLYIATLAAAGVLIRYSWIAYAGIVAVATAAFVLVCAQKTRGGWRWRWGERD